jgi:hypothetical protein
MNCFKHNDRSAVGICKSCGKGVCMECAAQQTNGIACKGECEARVDLINKMVDNNAKLLAASRYQTKTTGLLTLILGIVFMVFAAICSTMEGWMVNAAFFGCLGLVTVANGILRLNKKSAFPKTDK